MGTQHDPDLFEVAALSELRQQHLKILDEISILKPRSHDRVVKEYQLRKLNLRILRMETKIVPTRNSIIS